VSFDRNIKPTKKKCQVKHPLSLSRQNSIENNQVLEYQDDLEDIVASLRQQLAQLRSSQPHPQSHDSGLQVLIRKTSIPKREKRKEEYQHSKFVSNSQMTLLCAISTGGEKKNA